MKHTNTEDPLRHFRISGILVGILAASLGSSYFQILDTQVGFAFFNTGSGITAYFSFVVAAFFASGFLIGWAGTTSLLPVAFAAVPPIVFFTPGHAYNQAVIILVVACGLYLLSGLAGWTLADYLHPKIAPGSAKLRPLRTPFHVGRLGKAFVVIGIGTTVALIAKLAR